MSTPLARGLALSLLALAFAGCPPPEQCDPTVDDCTDGGLPPDWCDTQAQADQDAVHCHLTLGQFLDGGAYLSTLGDGGVDRDWYLAQMPATLTGRSLLHVNAGYTAPQTGVNFQVNLLTVGDAGTLVSVASGVDVHGTAAPKPVDLVVPFARSGASVYVLVQDQATGLTTHVDNRNRYQVLAEVIDNPDPNEPNDTVATPITLSASGGGVAGTTFGYLATDNDVDRYSFVVSSGTSPRQIVYLHLTGPAQVPTPPPFFGRLAYTLYDPDGNSISEGAMDNAFLPIDLATARLAPKLGTYTVKVQGFQPANSTGTVKGDLRIRYDLEVRVLPDVDNLEGSTGNDSYATARVVSFGGLGTQSLTGKLSYVQDEEWFKVTLPARAGASTFRYKVEVASGGGRFTPTSPVPTRQLRVLQPVTAGATRADRVVACTNDPVVCPKGFSDPGGYDGQLVASLCRGNADAGTDPLCLYAERDEASRFDNLKNEVGAIPINPNTAATVYVMFRDQGLAQAKYADDRDWTLTLEYADDPDRTARLALGGPTVLNVGGATTSSSGQLTFGYGGLLDDFDITSGAGIRATNDYDAFLTDSDLYQINVPASGDLSWAISWDLSRGDGGTPPGDIALELTFCTSAAASTDGGYCQGQERLGILGYTGNNLSPWYQPNNSSTALQLWDRTSTAGTVTFTYKPVGCACVNGRHSAGGRFFANVIGVNRISNAPISYTLRQSLTTYPSAAFACPVVDAGCGFDKVP